MSYEASLKQRRDAESVFNSAMRAGEARGGARGRAEGLAEGARKNALETAKEMKKAGLSIEQIVKFTKLSVEEIEKLK
ncbi:hypothetical protein [Sphingobacterium faecale]|uniref:Transposase/invertase (TIGR01784 family) n=1 Tax=Sphingobacterium faecale TaxID=2803775 RepID=A0ABS1R738_9SPHI|nr:hypothetical protein [Sphingobacterium faecale]MBL1410384.1 hypothetical protein [Sphingobacterium faecale]